MSRAARNRDHDRRRRQQSPARAWYKTQEWLTLRTLQHRGNPALFFDPSNLQSLCKACHDGSKQSEERRGYVIGNDATGRPLDPNHPWNKQ
jgi:hypothetical protein